MGGATPIQSMGDGYPIQSAEDAPVPSQFSLFRYMRFLENFSQNISLASPVWKIGRLLWGGGGGGGGTCVLAKMKFCMLQIFYFFLFLKHRH